VNRRVETSGPIRPTRPYAGGMRPRHRQLVVSLLLVALLVVVVVAAVL
jgi:hypothetical protein